MIEKRYCLTPEEWAYAKAELVLAEKLGLIENADIEALEKGCAEKNEENARLEMEKKVFYGPRRYSLPNLAKHFRNTETFQKLKI